MRILPPVFSAWPSIGLQGVLRKVLDVRTGFLKNSENLKSFGFGRKYSSEKFFVKNVGVNSSL